MEPTIRKYPHRALPLKFHVRHGLFRAIVPRLLSSLNLCVFLTTIAFNSPAQSAPRSPHQLSIPLLVKASENQKASPTVTLSTASEFAYPYESFLVTWSSTNARSCTATGDWTGIKPTAGSESVIFETVGEREFILSCRGERATTSVKTRVAVVNKPLETGRYTRADGRDIFVDKGSNNLFHLGLNPRYLTEKHSGYTYNATGAVVQPGFWGDTLTSCSPADLNGDEYPDAIIGTALGFSGGDSTDEYDVNNPEIRARVHFLLNNGDGSFSDGSELIPESRFHRVTSYKELHIGDLNGDGLDDIAAGSNSAGGIVRGDGLLLLVSQADGTYKDETDKVEFDLRIDVARDDYVQEGVLNAEGGVLMFFDLDGDGHKDLFNTHGTQRNGPLPQVFLSQEGEKYVPWPRWQAATRQTSELFPASLMRSGDVVDFDNDGDEDIVLQCYNRFCFGDPSDPWHADRLAAYDWDPARFDSSNGFVIINTDGNLDMNNAIHFPKTPLDRNTKGDDIDVGDINGDGFPDVVVAYGKSEPYYVDRKIQVLINKNGKSLADETDTRMPQDLRDDTTGHAEGLIKLIDYDNDGDLDIFDFQTNVRQGIYTERGTQYPYGRNGEAIFINDGLGNFTYKDLDVTAIDELVNYDSKDEDFYRDNWVGDSLSQGISFPCPIPFGAPYGSGLIFEFGYENEAVNNRSSNLSSEDYSVSMFGTIRKLNELDVENGSLYKAMEHVEVSIEKKEGSSGNIYSIAGEQGKTLTLKRDKSYKFVHSAQHPLRFSKTPDGIHHGGGEYTRRVTANPGESIIQFSESTPSSLYYYCEIEAGMGGEIILE